jgi:hypothetical protein
MACSWARQSNSKTLCSTALTSQFSQPSWRNLSMNSAKSPSGVLLWALREKPLTTAARIDNSDLADMANTSGLAFTRCKFCARGYRQGLAEASCISANCRDSHSARSYRSRCVARLLGGLSSKNISHRLAHEQPGSVSRADRQAIKRTLRICGSLRCHFHRTSDAATYGNSRDAAIEFALFRRRCLGLQIDEDARDEY